MLAQSDLLNDLRRAGICQGDTLIVHSAYKSTGGVQGGPAAVIAALQKAIGAEGLLAIPTFTFGHYQPFVVAESPSRVGAITEVFRTMPDVVRSTHPSHSMAFWGKDARAIAAAHENTAGLDAGSPYHLASRHSRAFLLQIGTTGTTNSFVHVCEAVLDLPYVDRTYWGGQQYSYEIIYPDGRNRLRINNRVPGCSRNFAVVDRELQRMGKLRVCYIGFATCRLLKPEDVLQAVNNLIGQRADALLCNNPECTFCPGARSTVTESSAAAINIAYGISSRHSL